MKSVFSTLVCGFINLAYLQLDAGLTACFYLLFLVLCVIVCWPCIRVFAFVGLANKSDALKTALVAEFFALLEFAETFHAVWGILIFRFDIHTYPLRTS